MQITAKCRHTHHHHCSLSHDSQNVVANLAAPERKELQDLFQQAVSARDQAYAPNSQFKVGAAILAKDGSVYTGSNKELTINADHAEQRAINQALLGGQKPHDLKAIAIFGARGEVTDKNFEDRTAPCGNCRQALYELNPDMLAVGSDGPGKVQAYTLTEELPDAYHRDKTLPTPPAAIETGNPLINAALQARSKSYVPRSNQPVGAAVETDKGIFLGTRAEVSSFTSQAARMALGAALEAGATHILKLAIIAGADSNHFERPADLPFDTFESLYKLAPNAEVILPDAEGKLQTHEAKEFPQFLFGKSGS